MSLGVKLTEYKLNYIENAGKLDTNSVSSPKQEFDRIVPEYNASKDNFKHAKHDVKEAEVKLQEYENKSLAERARHPIKNRRLHNQLRNNLKAKKIVLEKAKIQYKAKQREMREIKRTIGNQFRAVKDFEKVQKMYKEISDPTNSKYVTMFPAQKSQIDAWYNNYVTQYNSQKFSVSKNNGINNYSKLPSAKGPEFDAIKKANYDCNNSKIKEKARNAIDKTKEILNQKSKQSEQER